MKKIKIHNNYDDWDYLDSSNMHRLKLKWQSRAIMSNILLFTLVIFLLTKDWWLTSTIFLLNIIVLAKLADDIEFI